MPELCLVAGDETEALVQFITTQLDDDMLDELDVQRDIVSTTNLVSEPITTGVALATASVACMGLVARLIERWLERSRQKEQLTILASTLLQNTEAGKVLAAVVEKHADVSLKYELSEVPTVK